MDKSEKQIDTVYDISKMVRIVLGLSGKGFYKYLRREQATY